MSCGAPSPWRISVWVRPATPAAADIFIQHSSVAAVLVGLLTPGLAVSITTLPSGPPLNDSAQDATGRSVVTTVQLLTDPVPLPTRLMTCCLSGSKLAATVRPEVGGPSGVQRNSAISWAVRATDQTRTPYIWPVNPVVAPNPAPSWKSPAACCGPPTVSWSAVATPSL